MDQSSRRRLSLFLGYAAIWSTLLLVPDISRILFIPSNLPEEISRSAIPVDKIVHACGYFLLTTLAAGAFSRQLELSSIGWLSVASILHGLVIEVAQSFVPERAADAMDFLADTVGVILALVAIIAYRCLRPRHPIKQPEMQPSSD
jgi:VanZ family protein